MCSYPQDTLTKLAEGVELALQFFVRPNPLMATAYLIHGYLGAGKTTFAKQLEAQTRAVRYSPDEWMTRIYGANPPMEKFNDYLEAVYDIVNLHWPQVLAAGVDVILDFGFWTRAWRDAARQRASTAGGTTKLFYICCEPATARARCLARNTDLKGSFIISAATFDALQARLQPLEADEPFVLIDTQ